MTDFDRHHASEDGAAAAGLPARFTRLMRLLRHPALAWVLFIGYGLLIAVQSSFPSVDMGPELPGLDKLIHLAAYTLMGVLACRAFATLPRMRRASALFLAGFMFTLLFGLTDEWHQSYVPGRMADVWDLVADALGGLLGAGFASRRFHGAGRADGSFPR